MRCLALPISCLCLLLCACAAAPPRIDNRAGAVEVAGVENWSAKGRIGVSGGEGGGSGSFVWDQERGHSAVQLTGPVGVGSVRLEFAGDTVTIETADGQKLQSKAALDQLRLRLGADIPIEKLRYWIVGSAAPGPHHWLDPEGTQLEQDGWHIEYQNFLSDGGIRLPVKLLASSGSARVRVIVDRWEMRAQK